MRTLALLLALAAGPLQAAPFPAPVEATDAPTQARVLSVYDGDTFTLETGDKVRLRWVNTPELRPYEAYGNEAKQFTHDFVALRTVRLAVAPEKRDGYGRLIAGVTTDRGDLSIGLLEAGLAHVFVIPPDDADLAPLLAAEARARAARRGIWSTEAYQGAFHLTSFHANAPGPDEDNVNGEYLRVANVSGADTSTKGWTLRNKRGTVYPLPAVVVPAGHTVQVRAGQGADVTDPTRQLEAHLGSPTPIFDNDGDTAELLDPGGRVVDQRRHKGG